MRKNKAVSTEYAVEVTDAKTYSFLRQIAVFKSYSEACNYVDTHCDCDCGEYYNIIFINYDANGDETDFGTVC